MTIKEFAYLAQQHIQGSTGLSVKRAHIYELLAASFGFKSYAAFNAEAFLADAGVGTSIPGATPELMGRALQLGYPQTMCPLIAQSIVDHAAGRALTFVRSADLLSTLAPSVSVGDEEDADFEDWDTDSDDEETERGAQSDRGSQASTYLASGLLAESLEQAAAGNNAIAHFALAALTRCERPNGYLYEESLKGRILNKVEEGWVAAYLENKPRYEKYEYHLRQAAVGGIRFAAAECAQVFNDRQYFALAERGTGPIDARQMVAAAGALNDRESRARWLRVAAEQGSSAALSALARGGDLWALRKQAEAGDCHAIRELAELAANSDPGEAWMWRYLAEMLGEDLTASTMRAYHDGGSRDGEKYDDDYGGPLYVAGDEGLELPPLEPAQDRIARQRAEAMFSKIESRD